MGRFWEKNLASYGPTALGRTRFFALGLIFEDFSTRGMKKFSYLETGPFGNPIHISKLIMTFEEKIRPKFSILAHRMAFKIPAKLNLVIFRLENGLKWPTLCNS